MKKLMIAAAIVCAAAFVQAASVTWTATQVKVSGGASSNSGIAYFLNTTDYGAVASWIAMEGQGATAFTEKLGDAYSWTPATAGKYSNSDGVANATLGLSDTTPYSGYLVIFDTTEVTDASHYFVTDAQPFTTKSGNFSTDVTFGNLKEASSAAGNWHAVGAVPEPTSGLLLLLGVAGLALRRRRA